MFCLLYLIWLTNKWLVKSLVQFFSLNLEIVSRTKTPWGTLGGILLPLYNQFSSCEENSDSMFGPAN